MTLNEKINIHDNNYENIEKKLSKKNIPNLSIVIPYYKSEETIPLVIKSVEESCQAIKNEYPDWKYMVSIIIDGCDFNQSVPFENWQIISLRNNMGRSYVRNIGISASIYEVTLCIDADVIISKNILLEHLYYQQAAINERHAIITCSFFNYLDISEYSDASRELCDDTGDYRIGCIYQAHWKGCENDVQFAGNEYHLLEDTNKFKNWPKTGNIGPWTLPNMVLGGCFAFPTFAAQNVNGQDIDFTNYGFEETSLAAKLIAYFDAYVIPITCECCLHLEHMSLHQDDRKIKDDMFMKSHKVYFDFFLNKDIDYIRSEKYAYSYTK